MRVFKGAGSATDPKCQGFDRSLGQRISAPGELERRVDGADEDVVPGLTVHFDGFDEDVHAQQDQFST